ncbi:MAG: TOTE conflict system archaeo-eukaryotic primase domain-containing protein [Promethearchaeota archaeon]
MRLIFLNKDYLKRFKKLFIGNNFSYGLQNSDGSYRSIKGRITFDLLRRHLEREITIGSYYIYKRYNVEYCRWICIDIDAHDPGAKDLVDGSLPKIVSYLLSIYNFPEESILVERSGRGYHFWLFLKDLTTLKRAYSLKEDIEEKLSKEFSAIDIEIFPKQKSLKGLKGFGNFVKLPFSINRKNNILSVPVYDFDLMNVKPFDIKELVKKIRKEKWTVKQRQNIIILRSSKKGQIDLSRWKPYSWSAKQFYEKLRPCTREIVLGRQTHQKPYSHVMRIQVANELFRLHAPLDVRIKAFERQVDFDYEKTRYQVEDLENRCRTHGRFFIARCSTIQKYGYCVPWCYKLGTTVSKQKFLESKKRGLVNGITGGWNELRKVVKSELKSNNKVYFEKTTRAGLSWTVIIEGLKAGKKLLVIGPTIKMAEEMVTEAISKSGINAKMFRFGSVKELCNLVMKKVIDVPVLSNFPFFIKGNCNNCSEKCLMKEARDNIEKYDIIYTTIAKLHALIKTHDHVNKNILKKILNRVDLIFIDEVSHIIEVGSEGFEFYSVADKVYSSKVATINFYKNFHEEYEKFLASGLLDNIEVGKREVKKIFESCKIMVGNINTRLKTDFLPGMNFMKVKSEVYQQIESNDKYHDEEKKRYKHYGSGIIDWLSAYQLLQKYTEKTEEYLPAMVKSLLVGKYKYYYIQLTNPIKYEKKFEIFPAVPVKEVLDFVEKISKDKIFFCTDATEPPIVPEKLFFGLKRVYVNDPKNTAAKSTIFYDIKHENLNYFDSCKDRLEAFLERYSDDRTFIVCQNIKITNEVRKLIKKNRITYGIITYYRSPYTIGVASILRKMITIGSPHPPKNCYMWLADLYRKEGIVKMELEELGKKLEYYNAKNTFFQAISRVKDPYGQVKSEIYCFGLNKSKVLSYLNFNVSVPKIKSRLN